MKKVEEDKNDKGQRVNWEVELWEWKDYLRKDTKITRKPFHSKTEAQEWIKTRMEQMLVVSVRVERLTFDNLTYPVLPSRKVMYTKDFN